MKLDWKAAIAVALLTASIAIGVKVAQLPKAETPAMRVPGRSSARTVEAIFHPAPKPDLARWQPLMDDSLTWQKRLELMDGIRAGITPEEISFLLAALDHQPIAGTEEQWWVVINEIMERLRKHGLGADRYSTRLGEVASDSKRPEVVRDYAVQHLLQWVSPANPRVFLGEDDRQQRRHSLELVARIIRDPSLRHGSIPGTALLALADASARLPREEAAPLWDDLDSFLAPLCAGGSDASQGLHISAIQAAALTGRTVHLPAIRSLAMNEAADPSLRLTSIAALGLYGVQDSREFLESVTRDGGRFSYAAQSAINRLDQHLVGNAK